MDSDDRFGCFIAVFAIVAFFSGFFTGWFAGSGELQREGIKHGAAEYILDPATGKATWQWKPAEGWKKEVKDED